MLPFFTSVINTSIHSQISFMLRVEEDAKRKKIIIRE